MNFNATARRRLADGGLLVEQLARMTGADVAASIDATGAAARGGDWVLDVFGGANAPLMVAEVELADASDRPPIPAWCVRELTGRRELSNASLASHPLEHWSLPERRELFGA